MSLYATAGQAGAWFFSSSEADASKKPICGEGQSMTVRRLSSDEKEDLCSVNKNKVMLVVNTASRCGFTDQYEGLEKLYSEYRDRGLVVVGFPSNDFAGQEPGSEQQIKNFCRMTYGIQFPMYEKTRVKGDDASPLYKALAEAAGHRPRWNFHKYLIDRDGNYAGSFNSMVKPRSDKLVGAIEALL
jgi:glutathione peroxidase